MCLWAHGGMIFVSGVGGMERIWKHVLVYVYLSEWEGVSVHSRRAGVGCARAVCQGLLRLGGGRLARGVCVARGSVDRG